MFLCERKTNGRGVANILEFNRILGVSDKIVSVLETYIPDCMHKSNRHLVDHSAYYTTYLNQKYSGAAYTLKYDETSDLNIIIV